MLQRTEIRHVQRLWTFSLLAHAILGMVHRVLVSFLGQDPVLVLDRRRARMRAFDGAW